MHVGIGISNRQWSKPQLTHDDEKLLVLMYPGVTAVKMFSYHRSDAWLKCEQILRPKLWVCRLNDLGDRDNLRAVYHAGYRFVLELGNEPNNPRESWGGKIDAFVAWYKQAKALAFDFPGCSTCFPGLSPAYKPELWWTDIQVWPLIERADYLGLHAYYSTVDLLYNESEGLAWLKGQRLWPDKKLLLTEFACTAGEAGTPRNKVDLARDYMDYVRTLRKGNSSVEGIFFFLLGSDDKHWLDVGETFDPQMAQAIGNIKENTMTATIGNLEVLDLRSSLPDEPGKMQPVPFTEKDFISIHHTATSSIATPKSIYDYHKGLGWGGIGYNFLVTQTGTIYYVGECNTERAAIGQISQGNRRGIHIAMIIHTDQEAPSEAMLASVKTLVANLQHAYGWFMPVVPHRLFNSSSRWNSACPGDGWRTWWKQILRAVGD